jgi:hypothetical protein
MLNMVGAKMGNRGNRKKKGKQELSASIGNDGRFPWLRQPRTRSVEISTLETIASTAILGTSMSVPTFGAQYFQVSSVNDVNSFGAVFDQYRIHLIEVLIEPQVTEVTTPATDVAEYISVVDIDDANVPTVYADLCSYSTAVQTRGTLSHYHRFVPGVAVAVYSGAFTSFASTTSLWLDMGSPNIQHYGLKIGSLPSSVTQSYYMQVRMHVMWRGRH